MGDVFKLFGRLVVDGADKAKKDIEGTGKVAEQASEKFSKVGTAVKKGFDPEKVKGFGDSIEKLDSQISSQQKQLDQLKRKYAALYSTQGKTSSETRETANEIKRLSSELSRNKKALNDAKKAADGFDETLEDLGDESKETGKITLESLIPIPPQFQKIATTVGTVVTTVVAAGKAIVELANSTREYRVEMAKLETAFVMADYSANTATTTYQMLYSVLGDTGQAVEAANMLARLCDNEEQLAKMTKACTGVYATFGNSLPIEGLAEAANETAKVGTVTGQLADALNWIGISEDDFNEKLSKCNDERERTVMIIETLLESYGDAAETYQEQNEVIMEAYLAQAKLNEATAKWGELCEPIATWWTNFQADFLDGAYDLFTGDSIVDVIVKYNVADDAAQYDTPEKITDRLEVLQSKLKKLNEMPTYKKNASWFVTVRATQHEIELLEIAYHELAGAEQEAVDAANALTDNPPDFTTITNQYVADAIVLLEQYGAAYESIYSKVSGWFAPFEQATITVTTSIDDMMKAMQSQIDFNNAYNANLQTLKDYGLGELSEAFQAYGANGAAYAQAIVDAIEKAGGATTEEGQEIINGLADMNQQVADSQGDLTDTMTLMNGEFEKAVKDMADTYGIAIDGLDKSAEARAAAKSTFEAFLQEMNTQIPEITETMTRFGEQITSALKEGMTGIGFTITPSVTTIEDSFTPIPGHETGLDYVPYDNYLAYLHQGEAVLTAKEADAWRAGKEMASGGDPGSGGVVVNQYIEAVAQTPVELASATAAYFEQARWVT